VEKIFLTANYRFGDHGATARLPLRFGFLRESPAQDGTHESTHTLR